MRQQLHRYGDHPSQVCELHLPAGDGPYRVAVLIHGGFWRDRYGRDLENALARDLVGRGWAAWNVEYRRLGDGGGWPATFDDVAAAIDALPVDASRLVAIGHSAGGQLAVWAATRERIGAAARGPNAGGSAPAGAPAPRRITGAVSQAGALDLDELWRLRTSGHVVHKLLGGSPDELPERYDAASPARRLPIGVPLLLVHGELDEDVPLQISREFAAAARAAGDDCELAVIADEGHYEHLQPGSASWRAVIEWLA